MELPTKPELVFTKPAAVAFSVIVVICALFVMGWKAHAEAAPDAIMAKLEQMQIDIAVIKTKVDALEKRGR